MPPLLIHSMAEFAEIIFGALQIAGARDVAEIGSEYGTMTAMLLEYAHTTGGVMTAIDPAPDPSTERLFATYPDSRLLRATSLAAISAVTADAWIVDGDHNHYTVLRESRAIAERARATGRRLLAFYHDVGWPWGRRDLYYDPERIPAEHRRPFTRERGVTLDDPGTIAGGFRGEGHWACATHEGGPANGVLTAIEDFVIGRESELSWACVPAVFGLGVLYDRNAPWTPALNDFLAPWHANPLLASLERNRLECYLRVIEWQDRDRAA